MIDSQRVHKIVEAVIAIPLGDRQRYLDREC